MNLQTKADFTALMHKFLDPLKPYYSAGRCAAFQRGVGGDNSWGAKPHADACFAVEKGMTFSFSIQKQDG